MKSLRLRIDSTGQVRCLYTEAIDLTQLGHLEVRRASNIEFDPAAQQWEVRNPAGLLLYSNPSRDDCLAWEHEHLQP